MKLAIVSYPIKVGNVKVNFERLSEKIKACDASLIIAPRGCLTGLITSPLMVNNELAADVKRAFANLPLQDNQTLVTSYLVNDGEAVSEHVVLVSKQSFAPSPAPFTFGGLMYVLDEGEVAINTALLSDNVKAIIYLGHVQGYAGRKAELRDRLWATSFQVKLPIMVCMTNTSYTSTQGSYLAGCGVVMPDYLDLSFDYRAFDFIKTYELTC